MQVMIMYNYFLSVTFFNIFNLIFGIMFGFFFMVMITSAILSKVLSKYNKDSKIREISKKAYTDFYAKKDTMKDRILGSFLYELKEVSQMSYPDKKYPLYELSINELVDGVMILQKKLKRFISHPLCRDIKKLHISTILSIEENIAKPVMAVYNNKVFKFFYKAFKITRTILNIVNPIFYIKKILSFTVFKRGKKDVVLIGLDFIGNCCYEVYNPVKDKNSVNVE